MNESVGVDISPAAVGYARDRARASGTPCEYLHGDLRTVPLDGRFDLVLLCYGELNTFAPADVAGILLLIRRCLAPDAAARPGRRVPDAPRRAALGLACPGLQ
jgi:SAM-dependent methyltransferase